jgi:hypothetical protein
LCITAKTTDEWHIWVKSTYYRAAALLPASPRTADMRFEKMAAVLELLYHLVALD